MANIDIDPFGDHKSRPEEPMGENIPLTPGGGSAWEPECESEQETSFGGESQRTRLMKDYVKDLYQMLSENMGETSEVFHFDNFELRGGELYYRGRSRSLTYGGGMLRSFKEIKKILDEGRIHDLGFDIPKGKVTAQQVTMLNRELPSASDVAKADDIELHENPKSTEDLITQGQEMLPMRELLGLDKQLRSIRDLLKVEVAKKVQLEESIKKKGASSRNYEIILESTTMVFEKTS